MNHILFYTVAIVLLNTVVTSISEHEPVFKSGVRHLMNVYKPPKKPLPLHFSGWELTLINEMLMDIMMAKCPHVHSDEADDFKTYVSEQIAAAPAEASTNAGFLDVYTGLMQCSNLADSIGRVEVSDKLSTTDSSSKIKTDLSQEITENSFPAEIIPAISTANNILDIIRKSQSPTTAENIEGTTESTSQKELSTEKVEKSQELNSVKESPTEQISKTEPKPTTKPEELGFLGTVGHMFTKLYQNTVNMFSWLGRKKRQAVFDEDLKLPSDASNIKEHRRVHNSKANKHHHKKIHRRMKKGPSSFTQVSRVHFLKLFNSLKHIVLKSCTAEIQHVRDFLQDAIREIIWYIEQDLEDVASKGKKLTIDVELQQRVRKCSKSIL